MNFNFLDGKHFLVTKNAIDGACLEIYLNAPIFSSYMDQQWTGASTWINVPFFQVKSKNTQLEGDLEIESSQNKCSF